MSADAPPPLRVLPDGRGLWLLPQLFTTKLVVGPVGPPTWDDGW